MRRSLTAAGPYRSALIVLALAAVATGCFFRLYALDRKVYGFDETATLLRVAGATLDDVRRAVADGSIHSTADVRERFQRRQPGSGPAATVRALVLDDPQHPPLYYLLERLWQRVGTTTGDERGLAALCGVLLLPATFLFARELCDPTTALVAVALVAVSPFHVVFAQLNREYSLWAVLTLLASTVLLVALRTMRAAWWVAYAVAVAAGLYTFTFFAYVVLAHALYVVLAHALDAALRARSPGLRPLPPRAGVAFASAAAAGVAAFAPWIAVIASRWHVVTSATEWNAAPLPWTVLAAKWAFEIGAVFFDAEYARLALAPLAGLVLLLAAAACAVALRRVPPERTLFLALLIGCSAAPLVVPDVLLHQSRSTATRYLTPAWLGFELLAAAGIAALIADAAPRARTRTLGLAVLVAFLLAGTASLATSARGTFWWGDSDDAPLAGVARALDAMRDPTICFAPEIPLLIVSDGVRRAVRFDPAPRPGCLAIASAATMADDPARRSHFDEAHVPADGDGELAGAHAAVAKAHGVAVDPVRLWTMR